MNVSVCLFCMKFIYKQIFAFLYKNVYLCIGLDQEIVMLLLCILLLVFVIGMYGVHKILMYLADSRKYSLLAFLGRFYKESFLNRVIFHIVSFFVCAASFFYFVDASHVVKQYWGWGKVINIIESMGSPEKTQIGQNRQNGEQGKTENSGEDIAGHENKIGAESEINNPQGINKKHDTAENERKTAEAKKKENSRYGKEGVSGIVIIRPDNVRTPETLFTDRVQGEPVRIVD